MSAHCPKRLEKSTREMFYDLVVVTAACPTTTHICSTTVHSMD
jgi:hypothetical protein